MESKVQEHIRKDLESLEDELQIVSIRNVKTGHVVSFSINSALGECVDIEKIKKILRQ